MKRPGQVGLMLLMACLLLLGHGAEARTWKAVGTTFAKVFEPTPDGNYQGLGVELLREIASRMGDQVEFGLYPWPRAQAMVEQGDADILIGPYKSEERLMRFVFSAQGFYRDDMVFFVRRGKDWRWNGSFETLAGARIGAINGWVYGAGFEAAEPVLHIERINSLEGALRMLDRDRMDLLAANRRNVDGLLFQLGLGGRLEPIAPPISSQIGYFAFPKGAGHEALRQRFDQTFFELVRSGELKRMGQRFGVEVPN